MKVVLGLGGGKGRPAGSGGGGGDGLLIPEITDILPVDIMENPD